MAFTFKRDTIADWDTTEIKDSALKLLNQVCATLLYEPRYYASADQTRANIIENAKVVTAKDPEFVLKLALYVRDELNIRSTANFLIALATVLPESRQFVKFYFSKSVRLPTDIFEIVALAKELNNGTIPAALRSAVVDKFGEFDAYQLAKYNKENATKRKKRKAKLAASKATQESESSRGAVRGRGRGRGGRMARVQPETAVPAERPKVPTLKQLVRMMHISEPTDAVMAIVGKKYPATEEEFVKAKLPGTFDATLAGTRMKLPVPVTWETQLSEMGNNAGAWRSLIDSNKLPFMAMLRNLRNILLAGLEPKYHDWIINSKLTNEQAVATSRQLPFRFLSAYEIIEALQSGKFNSERKKPRENETEEQKAKREAKEKARVPPPADLLLRYKEAIDTSVKLSISANLKPIRGVTVAMCDISGSMCTPVSTAKGACGSMRQAYDISILLGLMLKYISQEGDLYLFGSRRYGGYNSKPYYKLTLPSNDSILGHHAYAKRKAHEELSGGNEFFYELFLEWIRERKHVDRMVIFTDVMIDGLQSQGSLEHGGIDGIVKKYRDAVNPEFMFVMVDLFGSGRSVKSVSEGKHPKDVLITGYSDQIFRFLAESSEEGQLDYVRNIDSTKGISKDPTNISKLKKPRKAKAQQGTASTSDATVEEQGDNADLQDI